MLLRLGCRCVADAKDPAKWGCGKDLKQVSPKGSGIYKLQLRRHLLVQRAVQPARGVPVRDEAAPVTSAATGPELAGGGA